MNLRSHIYACLIVTGISLNSALMAQEPAELITDRPDQTESSRVVPEGSVQVEVGLLYEHDEFVENITSKTSVMSIPSVLLRVGLTDWLELRGLGEYSREDVQYSGAGGLPSGATNNLPWGLGTKVQLLDEAGVIPETALIVHFLIPDPFKSVLPEFVFTLSHTLAPALGLGYNIGAEWNMEREHLEPFYTVALGADLSEQFGGYVELFGGYDPDTESFHSVDAGLTWLVQDNLQLDIAGGAGITEFAPDYFIGAGLSVRFPR